MTPGYRGSNRIHFKNILDLQEVAHNLVPMASYLCNTNENPKRKLAGFLVLRGRMYLVAHSSGIEAPQYMFVSHPSEQIYEEPSKKASLF